MEWKNSIHNLWRMRRTNPPIDFDDTMVPKDNDCEMVEAILILLRMFHMILFYKDILT